MARDLYRFQCPLHNVIECCMPRVPPLAEAAAQTMSTQCLNICTTAGTKTRPADGDTQTETNSNPGHVITEAQAQGSNGQGIEPCARLHMTLPIGELWLVDLEPDPTA